MPNLKCRSRPFLFALDGVNGRNLLLRRQDPWNTRWQAQPEQQQLTVRDVKYVPSRGSAEPSPEQLLPSYMPRHHHNHHNMTVSVPESTIRPKVELTHWRGEDDC